MAKLTTNRHSLRTRIGGLFFVLPSIITVLIFVYGMIIWSINVSLTDQNSGRKKEINYVGLKNYTDLISDDRFTHALGNLVKFTIVFKKRVVRIHKPLQSAGVEYCVSRNRQLGCKLVAGLCKVTARKDEQYSQVAQMVRAVVCQDVYSPTKKKANKRCMDRSCPDCKL